MSAVVKTVVVALVMVLVTARAGAAEMGRAEAEELFERGGEVFREGLAKAKEDYPAAEALFLEAASVWRSVAAGRDVQNAQLEMNIGNASLLGGDVAGAVLAYRRALAVDGENEGAKAGLMAARRAAGTQALSEGVSGTSGEVEDGGGVRGTIRQVGHVLGEGGSQVARLLPSGVLMGVAVVCYVGVFVLLVVRSMSERRSVRRWSGRGAVVMGVVCVVSAMPVVLKEFSRERAVGVVVQAGVVARNGPAELYDAAFNETLRAGLEVEIDEERGEWVKVKLADGRDAWVRREVVERV